METCLGLDWGKRGRTGAVFQYLEWTCKSEVNAMGTSFHQLIGFMYGPQAHTALKVKEMGAVPKLQHFGGEKKQVNGWNEYWAGLALSATPGSATVYVAHGSYTWPPWPGLPFPWLSKMGPTLLTSQGSPWTLSKWERHLKRSSPLKRSLKIYKKQKEVVRVTSSQRGGLPQAVQLAEPEAAQGLGRKNKSGALIPGIRYLRGRRHL